MASVGIVAMKACKLGFDWLLDDLIIVTVIQPTANGRFGRSGNCENAGRNGNGFISVENTRGERCDEVMLPQVQNL